MEPSDPVLEPVAIAAGRYRLRPPSPREAGGVLEMAADPEIRMWNTMPGVVDERTAREWCRQRSDWFGGSTAQWLLFDGEGDKVLGTLSMFDIDVRDGSAMIGYRVAPWARGQGLGTAAIRAAADWAFGTVGLSRLQLLHGLENLASCRVAQKGGFALEGVLRSAHRYGDGELHDEHLHARLASDPVPS